MVKQSQSRHNRIILETELQIVMQDEALDFLSVTNAQGQVIFRTRNPKVFGDDQSDNEIIRRALSEKTIVVSTEIVSRDELLKEGKDLAEQAYFKFIPTPLALLPGSQRMPWLNHTQTPSPLLGTDSRLWGHWSL